MRNNRENSDNFWVVYADLMAGLFFVFIVLVGAIIVKYVLSQNTIKQRDSEIVKVLSLLQLQEDKNKELEEINSAISDKINRLLNENEEIKQSNSIFIVEIDELRKIVDMLNNEKNDMNEYIAKLKSKEMEQDKNITEQNVRISYLLEQISQRDRDLSKILSDLNITRNKIKNLTGVKVAVISEIKEKLGSSVQIDEQSGSLRLSSSVLFDKGSSELKDSQKEILYNTLQKYFDILLNNKSISDNLDMIVIEGHTDSDGDYLYNLELSQARALTVMNFINSKNKDIRLRKLLSASGRSYMSPILKNGIEDKDASRRIEIKFVISNKEMLEEIKKILNYEDKN